MSVRSVIQPYVEAAEDFLRERPKRERNAKVKAWKDKLLEVGGNPIAAALAVRKQYDVRGESSLWLILATDELLKRRTKK